MFVIITLCKLDSISLNEMSFLFFKINDQNTNFYIILNLILLKLNNINIICDIMKINIFN